MTLNYRKIFRRSLAGLLDDDNLLVLNPPNPGGVNERAASGGGAAKSSATSLPSVSNRTIGSAVGVPMAFSDPVKFTAVRRSASSPSIYQSPEEEWQGVAGRTATATTEYPDEDSVDEEREAYVAQCLNDFLEMTVPESLSANFNAEVSVRDCNCGCCRMTMICFCVWRLQY